MTQLDSYLRGANKEDSNFLARLIAVVEDVVPLFYNKKVEVKSEGSTIKRWTWPYEVSEKESARKELKEISASTHCMILFALDVLHWPHRSHESELLGGTFRPCKLPSEQKLSNHEKKIDLEELERVALGARLAIIDLVLANANRAPLVNSHTYGENDPFTLTWLADLLLRISPDGKNFSRAKVQKCKTAVCEAALEALDREIIKPKKKGSGLLAVPCAFLTVRRLHLALTIKKFGHRLSAKAATWLANHKPMLWSELDASLHRQLAYSSMADPGFDPAELALALEGALLLQANWLSKGLIENVFEALKLPPERHPLWRPTMPFLANARGEVLFMVSVEVANSILRSCEMLDRQHPRPAHFALCDPQLRTYASWLLGQMDQYPDAKLKGNVAGWRTDYDVKRNKVQLWHTSHVLLFFTHYSSFLKRKIANDGIEAAGLSVSTPTNKEKYWAGEPLRALASKDNRYAVFQSIKENYILPRIADSKKDPPAKKPLYSMLLYGPPGTGKTTVAEQLAYDLDFPLIRVTVSDFLAAGAPDLENRAKGVFEVLCSQEDVVILFDEIDQFLLDRNSTYYREQDDVFKFMTPGMLSKLQDLRDAENSVFVVATNYYERIDSAIKRRGRIDEHYLLCLPDWKRRVEIMIDFAPAAFKKPSDQKRRKKLIKALEDECLHQDTVFFGWGDLKNLVESKMDQAAVRDYAGFASALRDALKKAEAAVRLKAYRARFQEGGEHPIEEFLLLLYLMYETRKSITDSDRDSIHCLLRAVYGAKGQAPKPWVQDLLVSSTVSGALARYLKSVADEWSANNKKVEQTRAGFSSSK